MSLQRDLLKQARLLATKEPKRPSQASLRRAVSASYYAVFHLHVDAGTRLKLSGTNRVQLRHRLARAFRHRSMKRVSLQFANGTVPDKLHLGDSQESIQPELRSVADAFCELQQARHEADYNLAKRFTRGEVLELINIAEETFHNWDAVRRSVQAETYLTGLLALEIIQG